jgi:hypothetical protein
MIIFHDEVYLNGFEDKEIKKLQTQMSALDKLFTQTLDNARVIVNKIERRKRRLPNTEKKKDNKEKRKNYEKR